LKQYEDELIGNIILSIDKGYGCGNGFKLLSKKEENQTVRIEMINKKMEKYCSDNFKDFNLN
jgi:hypothetical protein